MDKGSRKEEDYKEEYSSKLVEEQTNELKISNKETLDLLEELKKEVEARKKSEAALKESEQKYKAFFENSIDAILITQPDGRIVSANVAACEMFGRTEEELLEVGRAGVEDTTDDRLVKILKERNKSGRATGQVRFLRKNGDCFLAYISSAIFKSPTGKLFSSMIIRDVTQSVETERTMANERLLLQTLINNVPDSIYCKDLSCRKTLANKMDILYMGGLTEEDVIGKSDFDIYPREVAEKFYADDRSILDTGKPVINREEIIYDEKGNKKWLLSSKLPLKDSKGKIIGLVGIGRDITVLKQREQVLTLQYNMATAMAHRKSLQELFDGIRNDLNLLMEAEYLTLAMLNPETGMLYSPVDYEDENHSPKFWPAEGSLTGWLLKERKSCILTCSELEKLAETEKLERYGPKSRCWMGIPLFDGDTTVGAIIIQSYKNEEAYSPGAIKVVELIASQLSSYMKRLDAEQTALKLTKAVEQSPDTIVITNPQGVIEYVNPKFTEHTGYTAEEAIGKTTALLSSGKHSKSYYKSIWDNLLAGKDWSGEIMNRRKDGSLYWENANISPLYNNEGMISHYVAVKEEITEKKKIESILKYHVELQALLLKIASGYINVDVDSLDNTINLSLAEMGKFADADRAYIFEYDFDNYTTYNSYEWCDEGVTPQINILQNIKLTDFEQLVEIHKDGEVIFIHDVEAIDENDSLRSILDTQEVKSVIALPLMKGNKCLGFVGFDWVKKNHTYQEGEKVLLSIFSQLLVNVRLKTSLEHKLIVEKEKAEAANRLKTAFLNNISHEVRTPINGILGFGSMLVEPGITQEEKNEYYSVLQGSCNRLIQTITSFMDISLLTSGNMLVAKKKFSLNFFLKNIYNHYRKKNKNSHVDLVFEWDSKRDDIFIETDEDLLKKLFHHVLENAFKFTNEGQVRMGYTCKEGILEFFVNDNGIGIDPAILRHIFEPFVQEDSRVSRGYEGSGLGLSISRGVAELLGGTLSLVSEKGKGTQVTVTFPLANMIYVNDKADRKDAECKEPVVLIAEDDPVNLMYMETLLRQADINCISVVDGKQAVEACSINTTIRVVLMDLKMPVMGGLEATRKIKKLRTDLAVIAVTAHAMKGDREAALDAGCDDYLSKPYNRSILLNKVNFFLQDYISGKSHSSGKSFAGELQ